VGVEFCEYCLDDEDNPETDLRWAITERLPEQDFELYRQVANLVVPSSDPSKIVPRRLRGWASWEIFDMILTLTMILQRRSSRYGGLGFLQMYENFRLAQGDDLTWHQSFMLAARTVADWPKAIEEIIDLMMRYRDDEARHNAFGRAKEIGPLAFPDDLSGTPRIAAEITSVIDRVYPRRIRRSNRPRRASPLTGS
jgi:hypothetical protein